jgi:hypothetical protein
MTFPPYGLNIQASIYACFTNKSKHNMQIFSDLSQLEGRFAAGIG